MDYQQDKDVINNKICIPNNQCGSGKHVICVLESYPEQNKWCDGAVTRTRKRHVSFDCVCTCTIS